MDKEYLSVSGQFQSEFIVERSRFISYCDRVKSEEEAREFVEKIKKQNSLATHNCYAFIADETANLMRFSDDGEPQGTAGVPILDVIKNRNLRQTAVVVTRYFGGIKLGAGGLCRAYSRAASDVLDVAKIVKNIPSVEMIIDIGYDKYPTLLRFLNGRTLINAGNDFGDFVKVKIKIPKTDADEFIKDITDYFLGKVSPIIGESSYEEY